MFYGNIIAKTEIELPFLNLWNSLQSRSHSLRYKSGSHLHKWEIHGIAWIWKDFFPLFLSFVALSLFIEHKNEFHINTVIKIKIQTLHFSRRLSKFQHYHKLLLTQYRSEFHFLFHNCPLFSTVFCLFGNDYSGRVICFWKFCGVS